MPSAHQILGAETAVQERQKTGASRPLAVLLEQLQAARTGQHAAYSALLKLPPRRLDTRS